MIQPLSRLRTIGIGVFFNINCLHLRESTGAHRLPGTTDYGKVNKEAKRCFAGLSTRMLGAQCCAQQVKAKHYAHHESFHNRVVFSKSIVLAFPFSNRTTKYWWPEFLYCNPQHQRLAITQKSLQMTELGCVNFLAFR